MKKTISIVLVVAFMLSLTACAKPLPTVSSTPESTTVSTTVSTSETPHIDGDTYVFADSLEFTVDSGWNLFYDDVGTLNIELGSGRYASILFAPPAEAPFMYMNEEMAKMLLDEMIAQIGGGEAILHEVTEVTVGGENTWKIVADVKLTDVFIIKMTFWMCKPENNKMAFIWIYIAMEEDYDECLPDAQALVDSIRFI